ncbi:hypothetical protein PQX77_007959 [Marasmius sp. AFHP31]|nr:hypothetical protein PQX77_007959 [Marasmius sp. AFHP31]
MPSTIDLLQDDICLQFMASCRSKEVDHAFIKGIRLAGNDVVVPESFDQPTVISALTQTPIAIANTAWEGHIGNFVEKKLLGNGLTRLQVVEGKPFWAQSNDDDMDEAWLCQASRAFHAQGITLDDDLSVYRLIRHKAELGGKHSSSKIHHQQQSQQPIYLFLHPPPPNQCRGKTSSLHFWSFHEDSQKPLPSTVCNDFGLPTMLEYMDFGYRSISWSTKIYRQIDEYQRLRGFDPTTTDFAQHLGYAGNLFKPINNTNHFDKDYGDQHFNYLKSPPDLYHNQSNSKNNLSYPETQKQYVVEMFSG